jgi:hypothetical protein
MTPAYAPVLFGLGNLLILPCWLLLIAAPRSRAARYLFDRDGLAPMHVLAAMYAAVVLPALAADPAAFAALARPELPGVQALLGAPAGAAAGWLHFLCFDLLVGVQVRARALERGQSFAWVGPLLALVLMLGPLGWLTYETISAITRPRVAPAR